MISLFTRDPARPPPGKENAHPSEPLALLAAVADALPDPFLLLNRDGYVAIANRAPEDVFETQLPGKGAAKNDPSARERFLVLMRTKAERMATY